MSDLEDFLRKAAERRKQKVQGTPRLPSLGRGLHRRRLSRPTTTRATHRGF